MWVIGNGTDLTAPLTSYGAIGVILVLFVVGYVVPKFVVERETKRADAAEERERAIRDKLDDRIIPLLADVVKELAESTAARKAGR